MKKIFLALGFCLALIGNAPLVSAHAVPVEYVPAASSLLPALPDTVRIRFSERVEPQASSIVVFAPDGSEVQKSSGTVDRANARIFSTTLKQAGSGTYAVSWQVVSADDGHFSKGAFVFSVGQESVNRQASTGDFQIQHQSSWPEAITIWVELLGEAVLVGALVFIGALFRRMKQQGISFEAESLLRRRLRVLIWSAGFFLVVGAIGYVVLKSSYLAVDQAVTLRAALASFLNTVAGRYTLYRLIVGIAATVLFSFSLRAILASNFSKSEWLLFVCLGLITYMRARVSHAAASEFLPTFSILVNAVHLFFKDLWIGGLLVFVLCFMPALRHEKRSKLTTIILLRTANLLTLSLAVGGVTGVYIIWLHMKSFANLSLTHWGGYFIALSAYAAILLLLRLYQQIVINPTLVRSLEGLTDNAQRETTRSAGGILLMEMFIGVAVLLFSSMLIITTPPLSPQVFFERTVATSQGSITLSEHHFESDQILITITHDDAQGSGSGEKLTVTLENQEKGIGPILVDAEERFPGGYVFSRNNFSLPGTWSINVNDHRPNFYDTVGSFLIHYPDDIAQVHSYDSSRTFGFFESVMTVAAVILLIASWLLHRSVRKYLRRAELATEKTDEELLRIQKPWLVTGLCIFLVVAISFMFGGHRSHGNGPFQTLCVRNGGAWHESVPMRAGKVVSDVSVLGCMIGDGLGQFHFADPREFSYFTRRSQAYATLETDPATLKAGQPAKLNFHLKDQSGGLVTDLTLQHDRILHAVIVSQDLQTFAHMHVEDSDPVTAQMLSGAIFPVSYIFPKPGTYLIGVDFTVRAQTFSNKFKVKVGASENTSKPQTDLALQKSFEGMDVRLDLPAGLKAGTVQRLTYSFQQDGKPVTDLQPYLAAVMHMSIVQTNLERIMHTHAELPQSLWDSIFSPRDPNAVHVHTFLPDHFGPDLVAYVLFPVPGQYELFGEVKRGGKVILTRFTVDVP